ILLPRDPLWMYTYWEVTEPTAREIKLQHGENVFSSSQAVVRMHEINAAGTQTLRSIDVPVILDTRNWYLTVDQAGSSWFVELGLKTPDGRFIKIAQSNRVTLPLSTVSNQVDEKWASVKEDLEKV